MNARPFRLDVARAGGLTDARLQTHHAAQLASAIGISFVPRQSDDSHTNLGWIPQHGALASHAVVAERPFHLALRVADLTLLLLDDRMEVDGSFSLNGQNITAAAAWIRKMVAARGADPGRFTLDRHFSIPSHAVADGVPFSVDEAAFDQLSRWFASADEILNDVRQQRGGEAVRCWPHHFDIATLLAAPGSTIGVGMEPGDIYYDEPYYYVNKHPQPSGPPGVMLAAKGHWHTHDWIGAVLTGSNVDADDQRAQIQSFINSAIAAY
jgi:hypothetical protein